MNEFARLAALTADTPFMQRPHRSVGSKHNGDWDQNPDLTLLGVGRRTPPSFPASLLGPFWNDQIRQFAERTCSPPDYVGAALLASAGAMLANVRQPVAGAGWSEPPILWLANVGSPSSGKSSSIDAVLDLVRYVEERMAADFEEVRREYETQKQRARVARDLWETDVCEAVKHDREPPQLPSEAVEPSEPLRPRIRISDVTTERLATLAAGLPRGLLVVRDELAGWYSSFDRYGGAGTDRAFALEMYGGRAYVVDRQKHPDPIRIPHLSIGVLGGIQPDRLTAILESPDDGLVSRMLWVWPEVRPNFVLARGVIDTRAAEKALNQFVCLPMDLDDFGVPRPRRIPLVREAEDLIEAFGQEMAIRADSATGPFAGSLGKARGHALRLACVIEFLSWTGERTGREPENISARSVQAAAKFVGEYFVPMAEAVFGDSAIPIGERRALILARRLRHSKKDSFNARELQRQIGGPLRETKAMDAACSALLEAGLIRSVASRVGPSSGRQRKDFIVNPAVWECAP